MASSAYSPECVEGGFADRRLDGVLRTLWLGPELLNLIMNSSRLWYTLQNLSPIHRCHLSCPLLKTVPWESGRKEQQMGRGAAEGGGAGVNAQEIMQAAYQLLGAPYRRWHPGDPIPCGARTAWATLRPPGTFTTSV